MTMSMSAKGGSAFGGKKIIYLIPILAIVLLAAGCSKTAQNDQNKNAQQPSDNSGQKEVVKEPITSDSNEAHGAKLAGTRIELQNKNNLKPGEITLAFKLYGLDAHEFGPGDLKVAQEKLMHLMLVRDDMQYYQHLHPEYVEGRWTVKTQVPEQGNYEMYVDVEPKEEKPVVLRVALVIGGTTQKKTFPEISKDLTTVVDGITASLDKLELEKNIKEVKLKFKLAKNSLPENKIEAYLGAFGHVVALKHGQLDHFVHAHPLNETSPQNGIVDFEIDLQEAGMYTLYAQFKIGGQIKTFPITLEAEGSSGAPKKEEINHMQ